MMKITQNWQGLANIQFSMIVGLPIILLGYLLAIKYGSINALISTLIASCVLFPLALICAKLALSKRYSTIEYSKIFFGARGMLICSVAMGISLLGWFVINLSFMGSVIAKILFSMYITSPLVPLWLNLLLGILITIIVAQDLNFIEKFARWNAPFMLLALGCITFKVPVFNQITVDNKPFEFASVALILASQMGVVMDMPTYYRFAQSPKDAFIAVSITFGFIMPAAILAGVLFGTFVSQATVDGMLTHYQGILFNGCVLFFLLASGCMINNSNMYSCHIALQPFLKNWSNKKALFLLGMLGALLSCFEVIHRVEYWLDGISIMLSSMVAVILSNFLMDKFKLKPYDKAMQINNSMALVIGTLVGGLSFSHLLASKTGFSFIDASISSSLSVIIFRFIGYGYVYTRQT